MLLTAISCALIFVISFGIFISKRKEPEKLFGIYAQPGKWYHVKYVFFLTVLTIRKLKSKYVAVDNGLGSGNKNIDELETLQPLSSHEKAIDAVFFQAVNKQGFYVCGGLERRHQGKANGLFYIVVPGIGLLSSENLPNTLLDADPVSLQWLKDYSAGGIRFTPVKPMKKWKVSYEGNMKNENSNKDGYKVKFEAEWTSSNPFFFFDSEMSSRALARSIAREQWSKEYFDALKAAHQSHYEQVGKLRGKLIVNDQEHDLDMDSFRDHSFAYKRDWALMHRYIYNVLYLENGTFAIIGVISQPSTSSHLEMGYFLNSDKSIHAVEYCNLKLYQHGENGNPGKDYGFSFTANGEVYDVKAFTEYEAVHYKGHNNEAKLIERFLRVEVNGVKGRGLAEWHYNIKK